MTKPAPEFTPSEWRLIVVALMTTKAPAIVRLEDTAFQMAVKIASYTGQFDAEGKANV